jgi:hypothetical protein
VRTGLSFTRIAVKETPGTHPWHILLIKQRLTAITQHLLAYWSKLQVE